MPEAAPGAIPGVTRPGRPVSLVLRLISALVAIGVVCLVSIPILVDSQINRGIRALHEGVLIDLGNAIVDALVTDPSGAIHLALPVELGPDFDARAGTMRFRIASADGVALVQSERPLPPLRLVPGPGDIVRFEQSSGDGRTAGLPRARFWGIARWIRVGGRDLILEIGQDMTPAEVIIDDVPKAVYWRLAGVIVIVLVPAILFQVLAARAALRPLRRLSNEAAAIGPATADRRLDEAGLPRELLPVIRAMNAVLDRLEDGYRQQREFTEDVAHELRTPLSILRAQVDLPAGTGWMPAQTAALKRDIDGLIRFVNQLLEAAEADAMTAPAGQSVDLRDVTTAVASRLAPMAIQAGKSLALCGDPLPVRISGDADALERAIRNIIENAITHTRTGTTVEIQVTAEPAVVVQDQGPGIAAAERDLIFKRFWRRDRHRSGRSGLGLAITARIVAAHGGTIRIGEAPGGGALVVLSFAGVGGGSVVTPVA